LTLRDTLANKYGKMVLRTALYDFHGKGTSQYAWDHIIHCVEGIRQSLFCNFDTTLLALEPGFPGIPSPQMHKCFSHEGFVEYLEQHPAVVAD